MKFLNKLVNLVLHGKKRTTTYLYELDTNFEMI